MSTQNKQRSLREQRVENLKRIENVLEELTQSVNAIKRKMIDFNRIKQELKDNEVSLDELDQMVGRLKAKQVVFSLWGDMLLCFKL